MGQNGELQATDRLYFPSEVSFRPCNEGWLVIAVPTANWLVLRNDFLLSLLRHLIKGETIGEVFRLISTDEQFNDFNGVFGVFLSEKLILCARETFEATVKG